MSDYANKLSNIVLKRQKLMDEEKQLVEKRKKEIGNLAERFNLLTISDGILVGIFAEVEHAIRTKSQSLKGWENKDAEILKPNKSNTQATEKS